MIVPDYTAAILGYRAWNWDGEALFSCHQVELWIPRKVHVARCWARDHSKAGLPVEREESLDAPIKECSCGIYAAKSLPELCSSYSSQFVRGHVYLWGKVIEHEHGWRSQFAYPAKLLISPLSPQLTFREVQAHLNWLTFYGVDICVADGESEVLLWNEDRGYDRWALAKLRDLGTKWYVPQNAAPRLKEGEQIRIVGNRFGVVKKIDYGEGHIVECEASLLRILPNHLLWNRSRTIWEASDSGISLLGTIETTKSAANISARQSPRLPRLLKRLATAMGSRLLGRSS